MATVTQVASASISSGTTLSFTNINAVYGDVLVWTTAGYAGWSGSTFTSPALSLRITAVSPNLYNYGTYWQVTTPLVNATVTYSQLASAPATGQMYRLQPDPGNELILRNTSIAAFSSSSPSISTYPPDLAGSVVIGFGGVADDTIFTDSDTTDGTWSSVWQTISNASTDVATFSQYKITTGTATQTWGGAWATGSSEHAALSLWCFSEVGRPYIGMRAIT